MVPHGLVEPFCAAQTVLSQGIPTLPQVVLAEFMREGRFAAHIRRMRVAYGERRTLLVAALEKHAADLLEVEPTDAGMHLMAWLPDWIDDMAASQALWAASVERPLSIYCVRPYPRNGLLLGFTSVPPDQIEPNVSKLAATLALGGWRAQS